MLKELLDNLHLEKASNPIVVTLLSQLGSLLRLVDTDAEFRGKVKSVLDTVKERWTKE
jgi:hypothetical protein